MDARDEFKRSEEQITHGFTAVDYSQFQVKINEAEGMIEVFKGKGEERSKEAFYIAVCLQLF